MPKDPELLSHQQWLGYVQPVGLVVSPPALAQAQAHVNRNVGFDQDVFRSLVGGMDEGAAIRDFPRFTRAVLGWRERDLIAKPAGVEVVLEAYNETLRPSYAVREFDRDRGDAAPWMMLVNELPFATPLDEVLHSDGRGWQASPQARFERLLRETKVPAGLLVNGTELRLVYAPSGESSGHLTFPVRAMSEVAGRPMFAALLMLLGSERLFVVEPGQRLSAILANSRKYQNDVSTKLSRQVLEALYELVRGFQSANERTKGELLRAVLARDPDHVYKGLLTVLLRLVFLLYAEDRGLMPDHEVYVRHYSVGGLFERLRDDASRHPDTMDQRYGSWPQLLTLFRLVHKGARHGELKIPARRGYLFDPDRYPFLEGHDEIDRVRAPLVADGVAYRVLEKLLLLDGERISYRTLDVEQIGSVYETMMGFTLMVAKGPSIAVRPAKAHGAPAAVNLELLLGVKPADRAKWLEERTDQKLTGKSLEALKSADTVEGCVAALGGKVDRAATPNLVPAGSMVLQPSDERRRSGSHYTPAALTEPIVRRTLAPVLAALCPSQPDAPARGLSQPDAPARESTRTGPTPAQILALKVADIAVGSGAFLVQACRQLGDELVKAWHAHGELPAIPPDEDEILHARRLVAQRCLYGVDRNPAAVELTKLSLWLATLARDHDFTFLDHAVRVGDSLVGLTRSQIGALHWKPSGQLDLFRHSMKEKMDQVLKCRCDLLEMSDETPTLLKSQKLKMADDAVNSLRRAGDVVVAAYFAEDKDKKREAKLTATVSDLAGWVQGKNANYLMQVQRTISELRAEPHPIEPFHWEIEFPEVFDRENPGFDAIVGNPPFAGKNTLINGNRAGYLDWLKMLHPESHGNADQVAHFFRRAFGLLREGGAFGLIATNTIGQGDTRSTGLRWICNHGGIIYQARRRLKWPGLAAVVVSHVNVLKASGGRQPPETACELDGKPVDRITAYLFHDGSHDDPARLAANENKSFIGSYVLGMGFTFDDTDKKGVASPLSEMRRLIEKDARNAERIFPYIGGEEVNDSPTHAHHRYVINFGTMTEEEARKWPDLMKIVEERVKPERMKDKRAVRKKYWWRFAETGPALYRTIRHLPRVLGVARVGQQGAFTFLPSSLVFSDMVIVFALPTHTAFCTMQSRVHEVWARFFGSSMKDDLRYTPSDCFETFPFPPSFDTALTLEASGRAYYEYRAALMVENDEGLTKSYNRFHDPDERSPKIARLRELHAAMDRAVLDAYGWTDFSPRCDFLLDYEEDEDESAEGKPRKRKKPWRYRWIDEDRDWVLAELLKLNAKRAEEERLSGQAAKERREEEGEDE